MLNSKRQFQLMKTLTVATLAGSLFVTGCATKKYVNKQIDDKLVPVSKSVTDMQAAIKEHAERIDAVDRRAGQGITAAQAAQTAATAAQTSAANAQTAATGAQTAATGAQRTADTANQAVTATNVRVTTVETRLNNLNLGNYDVYTAGPIQTVNFKVGSSVLSDDAKKTLDGVAGPLASLPGKYQVEIQGFASAEGTEAKNIALSESRAMAVQRYLVSKNVALIRISILGVGPIGDKKEKEAERAANRRVEVRVFRAN